MILKILIQSRRNTSSYRRLNVHKIIKTIEILHSRIEERFPHAKLLLVCAELLDIAKESKERIFWIEKANYQIRLIIFILLLLIMLSIFYVFPTIKLPNGSWQLNEFLQSLDAITGIIIALSFLIYFFISFETRIKRIRALEALNELRAISHVIDMHQITKDPSKMTTKQQKTIYIITNTKSSPILDMDAQSLIRYLHYCTELLSLTGKIGALYGQEIYEPIIIQAINDIENLTTELSQKIWQKIIILHKLVNE